ncbi:MAG: biotin transporter BioY [Rhodothermales bacterium]|nr:biotin transporter BioY [Rhodothermales bacterium]
MNPAAILTSDRTTSIDAVRNGTAPIAIQITLIVAFAALTALGAQVRLYLWEVPFTLQTLAVYGSGLFLGWRNGMFSMLLYIIAGMFFPVFAGEGYGMTYLASAISSGYLIGFIGASFLIGVLSTKWNSLAGTTLSTAIGSLVLFGCGVTWLHFAAGHVTWIESIDKGWLRFVPVDLLKVMAVSLIYTGCRRLK